MNVLGIFCFHIFLIQYVYTQTASPPAINNSGLSPGFGPNLPSIPGPNLGLAGPNIGLAGQNLGIPRQDIGLPGPHIGLPVQNLGLAGQNPGLAGPNLGLVGLGLPGPNSGLPGPNIGLPGPNIGFPGPNIGLPGPNIGLPGHLPGPAFNQGPSASSLQSQPLGPGGPFAGNAGIYGGNGNGDVSVAGELPVAGTTSIFGQVPLTGKVQFAGGIPAFGLVTISGQCGGCNNGLNLPQSGKPGLNNKPYLL